ncbi:hypothetical protein AKO1_009877 [Acrasis kona]|uniref:AB hydrolase-1 domain-containing protein n=1 Tax=Acrasis kona TaxID=1008807 RepID=A0AAW2ZRK5_9EUKA
MGKTKEVKEALKAEKDEEVVVKQALSDKLLSYAQHALYTLIAILLFGFLSNRTLLVFEKNTIHKSGQTLKTDHVSSVDTYWQCESKYDQYERVVYFEPAEAGSHASFSKLTQSLLSSESPKYRVCSYDRPGRGFSGDYTRAQLPQNETVAEWDRFVNEVLIDGTRTVYSALKDTSKSQGDNVKHILVAHSYGANIALASLDPAFFDKVILIDPILNEVIEERKRKDIKIGLFLSLSGLTRFPQHTTMVKRYLSESYSWFSLASVSNYDHDTPKHDKKLTSYNMRSQRTFDGATLELSALPYINNHLNTKKIGKHSLRVIHTEEQERLKLNGSGDILKGVYARVLQDKETIENVVKEELTKV